MTDPSVNVSLTVSEERGSAVLAAAGELDYFTSSVFAKRVADVVDLGHPHIVLDLSEVSFCDSVGLSVLIQAKRRADRAGTTLVLRGVQPTVRRALSITGLDAMLTLEDPGPELTSRSASAT